MPYLSPREFMLRDTPPPSTPTRPIPAAARPHLDTLSADPQARETIEAQRAWAAHVDAGRIGVPAPPPPPLPSGARGDYRFASLAAILGIRA